MPISFDTQPSDLGFYFTSLAVLVEKHQPPRAPSAAVVTKGLVAFVDLWFRARAVR